MPALGSGARFRSNVPDFTVYACDMVAGNIVEELPVFNLKFGSAWKKSQNCTFDMVLGSEKYAGLDLLGATTPIKRAIYVQYRNFLVWGGIIWGRTFTGSTSSLSITCTEFLSFYERQVVKVTLSFKDVEQFDIVRQLLQSITLLSGGDIGMNVDSQDSGVTRTITYSWYDFKNVLEALTQMSQTINGFDYHVNVFWNPAGLPDKILTLGYPRMGAAGVQPNIMFDYPGNLTDYIWPEDGTGFTTDMAAIGNGEGNLMKVARAQNHDLISSGFPRLDNNYSYKDVVRQPTLDGHAQQDLVLNELLFKTATFKTHVDLEPQFGTYSIGDDARFRLTSEFHKPTPPDKVGLDQVLRISGWSVDGSTGEVDMVAGVVMS